MSRFGHILIVGSSGQLGCELARSFAGTGELLCHSRANSELAADLASEEQVRDLVRKAEPDLILNASAYTAVDRAESEPELALAINANAPRILAEEALRRNILLVHYSTDYVFDGSKGGPWVEADVPHPLNAYGASKLAGEEAVRQVGGKHLIFRTSWVYGPHGRNFLLTMLKLGKERDRLSIVGDQVGTPTTSIALADATRAVVDGIATDRFGSTGNWAGIYHMTCAGSTSWYGFAQEIFARAGAQPGERRPELVAIPSSEYPTPAQRPLNSVLSNEKLQAIFGIRLPEWKAALDVAFAQLGSKAAVR